MSGIYDNHSKNRARDTTRTASARPQPFRGPALHGLKTFGWLEGSAALPTQRSLTLTRPFHGPRRIG
ncbi:hypothetical protein [Bradyrhizobium sp. CCBAU 53338]|uniref:hypothetical protein n=1 Tax=Bradyrhizobium sp. CCBAU 53338 TaxID=1325111 RepID=UPI00188A4511|nr:hypothetical protein [Bradyrhizobium sp. CCBAU 53338]